MALADPRTVEELYWLGRVTLITGPEQFEIYDKVFRRVFEGVMPMSDVLAQQINRPAVPRASDGRRERPTSSVGSVGNHGDTGERAVRVGRGGGRVGSSLLAAMSVNERLAERTSPPAARTSSP